jgi:hydroxyacylglutathione hydrolase
LKANDLVCSGILLTHGHFDHILAARELASITSAQIHAHEQEAGLLADSRMNASSQIRRECTLIPEVMLTDDQVLQLAGFTIRVIHTPGHTAGGVCYYFNGHGIMSTDNIPRMYACAPTGGSVHPAAEQHAMAACGHGILFSGDTLFHESIGRTDLPTGDGERLVASIRHKLMLLDDAVTVYSGHGQPTTIGYEREHNIYLNSGWTNWS